MTQLLLLETAEIRRICLAYLIAWDDRPHTHTHTHTHTRVLENVFINFRALEIIIYYRAVMEVHYTNDCHVYGSNHRLPLQKYKNIQNFRENVVLSSSVKMMKNHIMIRAH